ncbi:hypothetical protein GALMADRAFT_484787 [Galerina marginata CBS 339.88]|uniref:Uncharacterized protein n=1 Tax=Galerina marginata (strain CBS 339.88) TaxID=685588 RepID=A0A067T967_GALM3|nr:hypothetical protein GALMADRAFT_484787 [Galerina marginata CBS 339.88]
MMCLRGPMGVDSMGFLCGSRHCKKVACFLWKRLSAFFFGARRVTVEYTLWVTWNRESFLGFKLPGSKSIHIVGAQCQENWCPEKFAGLGRSLTAETYRGQMPRRKQLLPWISSDPDRSHCGSNCAGVSMPSVPRLCFNFNFKLRLLRVVYFSI